MATKAHKKLFFSNILVLAMLISVCILHLSTLTQDAYIKYNSDVTHAKLTYMYDIYSEYTNQSIGMMDMYSDFHEVNDIFTKRHLTSSDYISIEDYSRGYVHMLNIYVVTSKNIMKIYLDDNITTIETQHVDIDKYDFIGSPDTVRSIFCDEENIDECNELTKNNMFVNTESNDDYYIIYEIKYADIFSKYQDEFVIYDMDDNVAYAHLCSPYDVSNMVTVNNYVDFQNTKKIDDTSNQYYSYYQPLDDTGNYCIGKIQSTMFTTNFIITMVVIAIMFLLVCLLYWIWSGVIVKPIEYFMFWLHLSKSDRPIGNTDSVKPQTKKGKGFKYNLVLYFVSGIIPLVLATGLFTHINLHYIDDRANMSCINSGYFYGNTIEAKGQISNGYGYWISSSSETKKYINEYSIYNHINAECNLPQLNSLINTIYTLDDTIYSIKITDANNRSIYSTVGDSSDISIDSMGNAPVIDYFTNDKRAKSVAYYSVIDDNRTIGHVQIKYNYNIGLDYAESYFRDMFTCFIYSDPSYVNTIGNSSNATTEYTDIIDIAQIADEHDTYNMIIPSSNSMYSYFTTPTSIWSGNMNKYLFRSAMSVSAFIILLIASALILSRNIMKPIVELSNTLYTDHPEIPINNLILAKGEFELILNRFELLNQQIATYTHSLQEQQQQNVDIDKRRRDAEIIALQTQINPHFLYNTFSSIAIMIRMGQYEKAQEMVLDTGKLLKIGIYRGQNMVPLSEEIDHITQYIKLQQSRYNDMIEVAIDIPEYARSLMVVKFILQPIIENSIEHNMQHDETKLLHIKVSAYMKMEELIIIIQDDGKGIKKEDIDQIQQNINNSDMSQYLGLANANERIKLNYGLEYGISLHHIDNGLETKIVLPLVKEDEDKENKDV